MWRFLFLVSLPLILSVSAANPALAEDSAGVSNHLANPFGAFTLGMDDHSPAQLVELMSGLGYNGLMAHTWGKEPIVRLRAYTEVPAIKAGTFRVYAILWTPSATKNYDEHWLDEVLTEAEKLNASLWVAASGAKTNLAQATALLARAADQCAKHHVQLVLYPHAGHPYETVEETLELLKKLNRPEVKLSIHLCHELKAGNEKRFDEIVARAAPQLVLASINGAGSPEEIRRAARGDWSQTIRPLDEGEFDCRPYLRALAAHGYRGPILLHTFGLKAKPEDHLARSIKQWRELSAEVVNGDAGHRRAKP